MTQVLPVHPAPESSSTTIRFWLFIGIGVLCFLIALVFARLNIVVVGPRYYTPNPSHISSAAHTVDEVRGWAPDVTNAGASAGFAIAGGLCMLSAAHVGRRSH